MARPEDTQILFDDVAEYVPSNPRILALRWWDGLDPDERVLYRGLVGVSLGLAAIWWPLAFIVPGVVVTFLAVFSYVVTVWRATGG
jgi:hypothetical protein